MSSSLPEKQIDVEGERVEGDGEESGSAIADGIRRDVRPWLNLVDDLSNLTRDAEISVPQVCVCVVRLVRDFCAGDNIVISSIIIDIS